MEPTVKEAAPPLTNSLGVISSPAINKMTIADSCPILSIDSLRITIGLASKNGRTYNAKGPTIIPANSSRNTIVV